MAYNGTVEQAAGIKPKNNGSFPMVNAHDVYVDDSTRLDAKLTSLGNSASIAPTEASSTAASAHAVGEYFFLNGTLYETTVAIAVGDTIASSGVNANCKTVPKGVANNLEGEVTELKSALNPLYYSYSDTTIWKQGSINTSNGTESVNTNRIITKSYINNLTCFLEVLTGYKVLIYGWNSSNVYQGCWTGSEFSKSTTTKFSAGKIDITGIKSYKIRLGLEKSPEATTVESDATNLIFLQNVDETLSLSGIPADAKMVGDNFAEVKNAIQPMQSSVKAIEKIVYYWDYAETVLSTLTKKEGYVTSASGTNVAFTANATYDSYYFYAEEDTRIYIDPGTVAYVSIMYGTNPTGEIDWTAVTPIAYCDSAVRYRKSDNNLPTRDTPMTVAKGTLIAVSVTAGKTCPLYIYENTHIPKESSAANVYVDVQSSSVTITGKNYEVLFSKLSTTQGYQWNITSLKGKGANMFPTGVDIIGVIQLYGKNNFMGGAHGNESNYIFRVLADGKAITTGEYPEIHVVMSSHLYDIDNTSDNVVDRFVEFVFTADGWTCRNTFKMLIDTKVQVAYPSGLFAFNKADCDGAYTNVGDVDMTKTGTQLQTDQFHEIVINLTNNITINMSSETADYGFVIYRANTQSYKAYFANAFEKDVTVGECISGKCTYRF